MNNKVFASVSRRQALHALIGLAAATALCGAGPAAAQSRTLKIGYILAKDSQLGAGASAFADELAKRTMGRITLEQFPNSALGGEVEMLKGVQLGTIDMAFITGAPLPNIVPEVGVFNIPSFSAMPSMPRPRSIAPSVSRIWKSSAPRISSLLPGARTACATSRIQSERSKVPMTSKA
jgi:hypothetical protein